MQINDLGPQGLVAGWLIMRGFLAQFIFDVLAGAGKGCDQPAFMFVQLTLNERRGKVLGILVYEDFWTCSKSLESSINRRQYDCVRWFESVAKLHNLGES